MSGPSAASTAPPGVLRVDTDRLFQSLRASLYKSFIASGQGKTSIASTNPSSCALK